VAHIVKIRVLLFQESDVHIAQNVLHAHTPRIRRSFFENIDHARSGEPDPIFGDLPLSFSSTES